MRNPIEQTPPIVTYVRVREIFHDFLRYKYGDFPIDLPILDCSLYNILSVGIVPNYKMFRMCYSSFSMAAYEAAFTDNDSVHFSPDNKASLFLPREEDKIKLIPFFMPRSVILSGRRVNTDKWFQFTFKSYQEFSLQIENEFWADYIKHDMKYNLYCCRTGRNYNQEVSMDKFMIKVGMDFSMSDLFARYWRKKKESGSKLFDYYTNKYSTANLQTLMENGIFKDDLI